MGGCVVSLDAYWANYDACLDAVRDHGHTVDDVIRICNEHYSPSAGAAFFPGGADRTLWDALANERAGWSIVWSEADYYFTAEDSVGGRLTYVEGDIMRGGR